MTDRKNMHSFDVYPHVLVGKNGKESTEQIHLDSTLAESVSLSADRIDCA